MYGAIIGDIAGSTFERQNVKTKDFPLFPEGSRFTDDTVMTVAVAAALLRHKRDGADLSSALVEEMQGFGRKYAGAGYGGMFINWLFSDDPQPYNSFGNGSAMRVSPCGLIAETLEEALMLAKASAEVTHNHPEGIKGAQAAAAAVFLAKQGAGKAEIRAYITENYYSLDFTLDQIRPSYRFDVTCQGSVPQAIQAFLESESYEDTIRNAISIGGDSDTIAAIAGGIAWAYYGRNGVQPDMQRMKESIFLPEDLQAVVEEFESVQSSPANSGSTLEEIQRRVNEYEKAAIAANDAGKIKTAGLMVRLFHDEDAMKEIARSTMIGLFMLLKYNLAGARTAYDDLMKELNRTYTYVNLERLKRQDSGDQGNS